MRHQHQQNTTDAITCIEMNNPMKRSKVDDYERADTAESGVISSFESREGGESVEHDNESSWTIVRTMDYYANDEDDDNDDNEYYVNSSVDEQVHKHEICTMHRQHIDHSGGDGTNTGNDHNNKFAKTFQANKISSLKTFEEWFKELEAFKAKNGHCDVPYTKKNNAKFYYLGNWCRKIRQIYKGNRDGHKLSPSQTEALKDIGFRLTTTTRNMKTFEEWFKELEAFKAKNGHCDVSYSKIDNENYPLHNWCRNIRQIYKGNLDRRKLSPSQTEALKDIGFRLTTTTRNTKIFEERLKE